MTDTRSATDADQSEDRQSKAGFWETARHDTMHRTGAEVIELPGGRHFDDDYETVARKIMGRIASGS